MRLIVYIDDILILAESRPLARDHVIGLIYLLENLGFVINKPKNILEPTQSLEFLGFSVNSVHQELSLPVGKVKKIRAKTWHLLEGKHISQKAIPASGKIASSNQGSTSGPSVLPQVTMGTAEDIRTVRSGLLCPTPQGSKKSCNGG